MEGNTEGENNMSDMGNTGGIEYTVEMDVPNINHLLNMYNINPTAVYNNTTNPDPMPFSSLNTNNHYCPADNISEIYDNIEPLYVSEIKSMKTNILDILSKRSDFKDEDYDDEKYENKEIDELYAKIITINHEFKIYQDKLYTAELNLKSEIDNLNSNIKKLENFITFLESLSFSPSLFFIKNFRTFSSSQSLILFKNSLSVFFSSDNIKFSKLSKLILEFLQ